MFTSISGISRTLIFGSGGMLVQDKFHGLSLGRWVYPDIALLVLAVLVALVTWKPFGDKFFWWRKPKLEVVGIGNFRRMAKASREENDLQVVYARLRNVRNGGGDRATLKDAEAWMTVVDTEGRTISHGNKGNWLNVKAGTPDPHTFDQTTFRPNGEQFALEIAAKFVWGRQAWVAGALNEQLPPGRHRIRASISDGVHKATVVEWEIVNPGDGGDIWTEGLGEEPPATSAAPTYVGPSYAQTEVISSLTSGSVSSATAIPVGDLFDRNPQAEWEANALALFQVKHDQAVLSSYRDILNKGSVLRDDLSAKLQGTRNDDASELYDRAGLWCDRCVLWTSDVQLVGDERGRIAGRPLGALSDAEWFTRVEDNLATLRAVGARLGL